MKKKQKTKPWLKPGGAIILTFLSFLFSYSLYKTSQKTKLSNQNLSQMAHEVTQLEEKTDALQTQLEQAKQPLAKEKIIRNELLMKKKGEYVIQIPEEALGNTQKNSEVKQTTPWEEWQKLLQ